MSLLCQQQNTPGLINDFEQGQVPEYERNCSNGNVYSHFTNCELLFKETASYQGCKLKDMTGLIYVGNIT